MLREHFCINKLIVQVPGASDEEGVVLKVPFRGATHPAGSYIEYYLSDPQPITITPGMRPCYPVCFV